MSDRLLVPNTKQHDRYNLHLNLSMEQYQQFKRLLAKQAIVVQDKNGEAYPSFMRPQYALCCMIPRHYGTLAEVQVRVDAALQGLAPVAPRPASALPPTASPRPLPPPAPAAALVGGRLAARPTIALAEWEQKLDQTVRWMRRQVQPTKAAAGDRLMVAEHIRNRQFGDALRELTLLERSGIPFGELAKQYLWVYDEQGNWPAIADGFERAREYLEGSMRAHMRAGHAYLELALRQLRGTAARSEQLGQARERLRYCLQLEEADKSADVQALSFILLARTEEAEGNKADACTLRIRAQVVIEQHGLERLPGNEREAVRLLQAVAGEMGQGISPDTHHWLMRLADGGNALMTAAGLAAVPVPPAPPVSTPSQGTEWQSLLEQLTAQLPGSPAETADRVSRLLAGDQVPRPVALSLRLLKVEADFLVLGATAAVYSELEALWSERADAYSHGQQLALLWKLVRGAEAQANHEAVLHYGEELLAAGTDVHDTYQPGELMALMGMAAERLGHLDAALSYLRRAEERQWSGKQVYAALARVHGRRGDADRELESLLQVFDEDPTDRTCLERLLELYMEREDWESSLKVCDQFLAQLETPQAARDHLQLYSYRKDCLSALIAAGRPGYFAAHAEAIEAMLEILIEAGRHTDARQFYLDERQKLASEELVVQVVSCLELGDAACRKTAATEYGNFALAEIAVVPRHDHGKLIDLLQRVYLLSEADYQELLTFFVDKQRTVNADANLRPEGGVADVRPQQLDLSGRRVVVVGAYSHVRQRVDEQLRRETKLSELIEVPPSWERNLDQDEIRELINGADLIVEVSCCIKHRTTVAVSNIIQVNPIPLVHAAGKGHSSIVRAVLNYFHEAGHNSA